MSETEIGRFSKRETAEREAASLQQDAPEGVEIVLHVTDDGTFVLCEREQDDPRGVEVFRDLIHGGHVIYWNGSATFSVWSALGNDFAFRTLREVNVFTRYEVTSNIEAEQAAASWWETYGLEDTLVLEREGL